MFQFLTGLWRKKGAALVPQLGLEDKWQITLLLACTMDWKMLKAQLFHEGKTEHCRPAGVKFPNGWNIWHSKVISLTRTPPAYINKILNPWATAMKEALGLPPDQPALVILDVFRAHRTKVVINQLRQGGFQI